MYPIDLQHIFLFSSLFLLGNIATGVGIGGGGLFVPLLILIGQFDPKTAIALSSAMITGGALTNYLQLVRERSNNRPLVNYHLATLMEPLALSGTIIGIILNSIFPNWLILLILVIVLSVSAVRSCVKARRFGRQRSSSVSSDSSHSCSADNESQYPWKNIVSLFLLLVLISICSLLKGETTICSLEYWLFTWAPVPISLIISTILAVFLIRRHQERIDFSHRFLPGDIEWTIQKTFAIASASLFAGVLASLVGIGGAMVISPIMIELGVLPEIIVATSSFMISFTATASAVQFLVLGMLPIDYGITLFILGIITSLIGRQVVSRIGRKQIIIYTISVIIAISTVLLLIVGVLDITKNDPEIGFSNLCMPKS